MPRIDIAVWQRFCERLTSDDYTRLQEIAGTHELDHCPLVEALRKVPREPEWYDVSAYVGDPRRCSAYFCNEHGPQVQSGGGEARPDGVMRTWSAVAGEFDWR